LSKFRISDSFEFQEANWRRWANGKDYLPATEVCLTGKLMLDFKQENFEIDSEAPPVVFPLEAEIFEGLVVWLPKIHRDVYIAENLNKVLKRHRFVFTKPNAVIHKQNLLGLSKYRYENILEVAVRMLKRHGGLV
jgi:hypothetical protein